MVSTLLSPSKALQWSGLPRRMGHCQIKQSLDGAHAGDKLVGDLFCLNKKFDLENLGKRHVTEMLYL